MCVDPTQACVDLTLLRRVLTLLRRVLTLLRVLVTYGTLIRAMNGDGADALVVNLWAVSLLVEQVRLVHARPHGHSDETIGLVL